MSYLIIYLPYSYHNTNSINTNLIQKIKTYDNWCMLNPFNFIISFKLDERDEYHTYIKLRDELSKYLNPDDKIFVSELTGKVAWKGFNDNIRKWIKKYLLVDCHQKQYKERLSKDIIVRRFQRVDSLGSFRR